MGTPKATIGRYVASQCIRTPRIFASYEEALESGVKVIGRSEHTKEYDGVSGLVESYGKEEIAGIEELKKRTLERNGLNVRRFCTLVGIDFEQFKKDLTYSYWELLGGYNRTVTADSAIPGRYHITTKGEGARDASIFENGKRIKHGRYPLKPELIDGLGEIVEFYERIRNLDRFDPKHCPIVEIQTVNGINYFLQYHRTRDFLETTHVLTEAPGLDYIEVDLVRGATSPKGEVIDVTVANGWWNRDPRKFPDKVLAIPQNERGACDLHWLDYFTDLMSRRRVLQIIPKEDVATALMKLGDEHINRSEWLKPQVSVMMHLDKLIPYKEWEPMADKAGNTAEDQHIKVHVVSDGRRAFIKRLN